MCVRGINCRGLTTTEVKPFLDVELMRRGIVQAAEERATSRNISISGLVVSFLALVVSFLSFRRRKGEELPDVPDVKEPGSEI